MGVFVVLILIPMMMQHIVIKGLHLDYQKRNKAAVTVFFMLLTLLVGFRHQSVGTDTENYIGIFNSIGRISWGEIRNASMEIGFLYLNKLVFTISKEPQVYLMVVAILTCIMIYPTYKRLCVDSALAIVLFCTMSTFVMMFSGIRQMLAIAVGFVAYRFIRERKIVLFLLTVFVAMLFHTSAFMLVFMYPLYRARITKKSLYIVAPILALCFLFNQQIFGTLTLILAQYTRFEAEISSTGAYTMLILYGIFVVFSFLIPDERKLDEEIIGLRNFLLLTFALQMFAPVHTLAMRMGYYYMIFVPLLLPRIIACRSKRWNQVAVLGRHVMVVFFLLYFFMNASGGGGLDVFPYHFFWENVG